MKLNILSDLHLGFGAMEWPVHPRSRGGALINDLRCVIAKGPSPLARGSRVGEAAVGERLGSIPARAGEPRWPAPS